MKEKILISKCLLGENVRYDGGHCSLNENDLNTLKDNYDLIPLCPEVMAGLGIPREPIERIGDRIISRSGSDLSDKFEPVLADIRKIVEDNGIKLAILKDQSPSCGSTQIYDGSFSSQLTHGMGIVAEYLKFMGIDVLSEENYKGSINIST